MDKLSVLNFLNKIPEDYLLRIDYFGMDTEHPEKQPELRETASYKGSVGEYRKKTNPTQLNAYIEEFSNVIINVKKRCCYLRIEE